VTAKQRSEAPSVELQRLLARRDELGERVRELEAQQRESVAAARAASEMLVELERRGAAAEDVRTAENALAAAKAAAQAPWHERAEAGRRRVRDAEHACQLYAAEHLDALCDEVEARGAVAAQALDAAAAAVVEAFAAREGIASKLGALLLLAGRRPEPGLVSYSAGQPVADAARALLGRGGEVRPVVRDRRDAAGAVAVPEPADAPEPEAVVVETGVVVG
jgi:hypothetical protein